MYLYQIKDVCSMCGHINEKNTTLQLQMLSILFRVNQEEFRKTYPKKWKKLVKNWIMKKQQ